MRVCRFLLTLAAVLWMAVPASAADVTVNCNNKKESIGGALTKLPKEGPNIIRISGTCNESLLIEDYDRLSLIGDGSATIQGVSPDAPVVFVRLSDHFKLESVTIDASNTFTGVHCGGFSVCHLTGVVVQGSTGDGILFVNSRGFIQGTIQNNQGTGLSLSNAQVALVGPTLFQNNGGRGITAAGSTIWMDGTSILNNGFDGIALGSGSSLRASNTTVSGNQGGGIALNNASSMRIIGSSITGNSFPGVFIGNLSFVQFLGGVTVTGNASVQGEYDIRCNASTSGAQGLGGPVSGGATTNCANPAP